MISECQSNHCLVVQEQEGLVKELIEILPQQKSNVAASKYHDHQGVKATTVLRAKEQKRLCLVAST